MKGRLRNVLFEVHKNSGADFSGVGLILYKDICNIPIFPLRQAEPQFITNSLVRKLVDISRLASEYHDGFHMVSESFELTHIAQYFSPTIIADIKVNRTKQIGGRYMAALFGSKINGVILTGIVTKGSGLTIFEDGREIYFEEV
jgi:hypothetical protein